MQRRRHPYRSWCTAIAGCLAALSVSGCAGEVASGNTASLVVERRAEPVYAPPPVHVTVIAPVPRIDARLLAPCGLPEAGVAGEMDYATIARLWNRDRAALRECAATHAGLVRSYRIIEAWARKQHLDRKRVIRGR